jgi:hypothetical protein
MSMLHWEILSLTDRGIPIGHLEKRGRARVNNHFNQSLNQKVEMRKDRRARIKVFFQILKIRLSEALF